MIHFIDITGLLLYIIFRILILPVLLVVGCFFILLFMVKTIGNIIGMVRSFSLKLALPRFRFAKLRVLSFVKH